MGFRAVDRRGGKNACTVTSKSPGGDRLQGWIVACMDYDAMAPWLPRAATVSTLAAGSMQLTLSLSPGELARVVSEYTLTVDDDFGGGESR